MAQAKKLIKPVEIPANAPYLPPPLTQETAWAIKAVATGTADAAQQGLFFRWLLRDCCKHRDMSYRPDNQKDQDFAEGKKYVSTNILIAWEMSPERISALPKMRGEPGEDDEIQNY